MSESTIDDSDEKRREIIFGACHHNINKISQIVSQLDSFFNLSPTSRRCSTFDQRLCWATFVSNHGRRTELKRHLRMSLTSFEKLLTFIRPSLEVDRAMADLRGGVIIPEIALYCTLRYIASGSYTDIFFLSGYLNHPFIELFGRPCTQLSDVRTYEFSGRTPKNWLCRVRRGSLR